MKWALLITYKTLSYICRIKMGAGCWSTTLILDSSPVKYLLHDWLENVAWLVVTVC